VHLLDDGERRARIGEPAAAWRSRRMSSRNSANSSAQERSPRGNSHAVVSGGPISGSILYKVIRSTP
jgi:hypothetical protein